MTPQEATAARVAGMRWTILQAISYGTHLGATDAMILPAVLLRWLDASQLELRREIDYLETRGLVTTERNEIHPWRCRLTRYGRDLVDYTVDCDPGIARPPPYWRDGA